MPDQEATPPARSEQNGATGPAPGGEQRSWGSSDRLENTANILTVLVALAAIGLSVWQGYQNRQFFRLSVLPNLEAFEITMASSTPIENEYFLLPSGIDSLYALGLGLENTGLGPAVLQNILVYQEEEKVFDAAQSDGAFYPGRIRYDLEQLPFPTGTLQQPYSVDQMIQAGEVQHLITVFIPFAVVNEDSLDQSPLEVVMDEVLNQRSIVVCYCSVYGTDCGMTYLGSAPPVENACGF